MILQGGEPTNEHVQVPNETVEVCCVLKGDWPGSSAQIRERCADLGAHYVRALYEMVEKFAPQSCTWRFTCFTDRMSIPGCDNIRLAAIPHKLEGYFSKLYLFNIGAFPVSSRVLFFDLDTCLVRSWGPLAAVPLDVPVMLRDAWWHDENRPASGVMSWRVSPITHTIFNLFPTNGKPPRGIATDEDWLRPILQTTGWAAWQDLLPDQLFSYKMHVTGQMRRQGPATPFTKEQAKSARVIFFHGLPRPHSVRTPWNPIYIPL